MNDLARDIFEVSLILIAGICAASLTNSWAGGVLTVCVLFLILYRRK